MAVFLVAAEVCLALLTCWVLLAIEIMVINYYQRKVINKFPIQFILFCAEIYQKLIITIRQDYKPIIASMSNNNHTQSHLEIYQMFTSLFVTISKGQQIIDSIKQVLTTNDLFHPLVLFKYLTKNNPILQPKHIMQFLQENNFQAKIQDVRIIFGFQGVKEKMNYSTFLKMIYPYSTVANREINQVHLKNYRATENLNLTQEVLASFYLFLVQQINLIDRIQSQKQDSFSSVPRQKVYKVLKNIKKLSSKQSSHCEKNQEIITGLELVHFVKNFTDVDESSMLYLLRRLGMDENGTIEINKLEAFVRPWKKGTVSKIKDQNNQGENQSQRENQEENENKENSGLKVRFDEEKYRKALNIQLSRSISEKKKELQKTSKRKNRKQGAIKIKQGTARINKQGLSSKSNKQNITKIKQGQSSPNDFQIKKISLLTTPMKEIQRSSKKSQRSTKKPSLNASTKNFIKFVEVFLRNSLQIERLKAQLNRSNQVNYLKIFKGMDRQERGILRVEDMQEFYKQVGGMHVTINFGILVQAYSQTGENWLSYSEFCEIFKPSIERPQNQSQKSPHSYGFSTQSQQQLFAQILYLTLLLQHELLQIRRQFTKPELFQLFNQINKEQTGFINYQELKAFLLSTHFSELSMYELMLVLKRLDKNKNGVVSQNEFVDYFLVRM